MTQHVLICDDSRLASKQLARSLPADWQAEIHFAAHGREALAHLQQIPTDLLFLDLNMPEMDGYTVLKHLQHQPFAPKIIVVSADIQAEAHRRVMDLGALDFLRKPIGPAQLQDALQRYQLFEPGQLFQHRLSQVGIDDALRELCNVAMGQAAASMSQVLGAFIELPIPKLRRLHGNELEMLLAASFRDPELMMLSQGFIGHGISGEAIVLLQRGSYQTVGTLLGIDNLAQEQGRLEVQMELGNLLFSAFLSGLGEQLNIPFCQSHPVLVREAPACQFSNSTLAVEISYRLTEQDILCDLLLLLPQSSLPRLEQSLSFLME
ncbi:response regulator [Ferrimonas pelagia]|uniref:Response regulator n=1 Tax=Ferrimonas pelagia TaxID=1177826 RepID=A0ABP9FMT2_9GAMM